MLTVKLARGREDILRIIAEKKIAALENVWGGRSYVFLHVPQVLFSEVRSKIPDLKEVVEQFFEGCISCQALCGDVEMIEKRLNDSPTSFPGYSKKKSSR